MAIDPSQPLDGWEHFAQAIAKDPPGSNFVAWGNGDTEDQKTALRSRIEWLRANGAFVLLTDVETGTTGIYPTLIPPGGKKSA